MRRTETILQQSTCRAILYNSCIIDLHFVAVTTRHTGRVIVTLLDSHMMSFLDPCSM